MQKIPTSSSKNSLSPTTSKKNASQQIIRIEKRGESDKENKPPSYCRNPKNPPTKIPIDTNQISPKINDRAPKEGGLYEITNRLNLSSNGEIMSKIQHAGSYKRHKSIHQKRDVKTPTAADTDMRLLNKNTDRKADYFCTFRSKDVNLRRFDTGEGPKRPHICLPYSKSGYGNGYFPSPYPSTPRYDQRAC